MGYQCQYSVGKDFCTVLQKQVKPRAPTLRVCFMGPLLTPSTMSFKLTQETNFTRYFKQDKGRALVIQDLQGSEINTFRAASVTHRAGGTQGNKQ